MTTPRPQDDDQSLKVKSRWFSVDFRGSTGALVACLFCAFVCVVAWKSEAWSQDREANAKARHSELMQAIRESNETTAYMLSLPMEEREKLRLTMPASLRSMQIKK